MDLQPLKVDHTIALETNAKQIHYADVLFG